MRYLLFSVLVSFMATAFPAHSESIQDQVARELGEQGYGQITGRKTFLGRFQIIAIRGDESREIVVNPRTGEVLRDHTKTIPADESASDTQ